MLSVICLLPIRSFFLRHFLSQPVQLLYNILFWIQITQWNGSIHLAFGEIYRIGFEFARNFLFWFSIALPLCQTFWFCTICKHFVEFNVSFELRHICFLEIFSFVIAWNIDALLAIDFCHANKHPFDWFWGWTFTLRLNRHIRLILTFT